MSTDLSTAGSFEVESGAGIAIEIPAPLAPTDELRSIVGEYKIGYAMREAAMFRVWRMWVHDTYMEILSDNPNIREQYPLFRSFADFVEHIASEIGVSRSKIYGRMKLYSVMIWLGFSEPQSVVLLADKPNVVSRIINALYVWDNAAREIIGVKTNVFGDDFESPEHKRAVHDFIVGACAMPNANDALAYIADEIGGSSIRVQYSPIDQEIIVWFFTSSGDSVTISPGSISFPLGNGEEIPAWVEEELTKKYGRN